MKNAEQKAIVTKLKSLLKQRGITYKELSRTSKVPESSIKKIFSGADCSLSKLVAICDALEVGLLHLASSIIQEREEDYFTFTLEQEKFFARNIEHFLFFHNLCRDNKSVAETQEQLGIGDAATWKILNKLERFNVLEVGPGMKVKIKIKGGVKYIKEGPLQHLILNHVPARFTEFLVSSDPTQVPVDSPFLRLNFARMTPVNYKKLVHGLQELHQNFSDVAVRDRKYHSKDELIDVTWLFGLGNCNWMALLR